MVQEIAQHLLLRQNQPAFRRGAVDRRDQDDRFARFHQVADQRPGVGRLRLQLSQSRFGLLDAGLADGADRQQFDLQRFGQRCKPASVIRAAVDFVEQPEPRQFFAFDQPDDFPVVIGRRNGGVQHDQRDIGFVQHRQGFLFAQFTEFADVVQPGGIDQDTRAQRQNFNRFVNRVGRRSLDGGDDRQILGSQGVDQTGFAGVAAAEQCDVGAFGTGSAVQTHE